MALWLSSGSKKPDPDMVSSVMCVVKMPLLVVVVRHSLETVDDVMCEYSVVVVNEDGISTSLNLISAIWSQLSGYTLDTPVIENLI